ncbi:MAG: MATE family efflux transporter [Lachnospiraceae bacterium]|nr:MATE family efflux transporter [Lachnospiraceae bacterium]
MKQKSYEIDMCADPLMPKLLVFSIPLILSGILQLLFNSADMIIIGRFAQTPELAESGLAAIGATAALINFFVNVIIGVSVGCNVIVARYYGAKKDSEVRGAVHTSIALCLLLGVSVGIPAMLLCKPILILMKTPENVLDQAVLYMRIYFAGLPVIMLYNFGSAILRAIGDTKRPLYYLTAAGIINVLMNLFFVLVLKMNVEGVALATVLSQTISAFLVLRSLMRSDAAYRLELRKLRIDRRLAAKIMGIGLPAGVQGMVFSLSNMLIQSSVNSFGSTAMAGNTAAGNLEGFVYTSMNSIYQTSISFTSQNLGGGFYKRINKILAYCLLIVSAVGLIMGYSFYFAGRTLLGLYSQDPHVVDYGMIRMRVIMTSYLLCGIMDVLCGSLRGLGYGMLPMVVSLLGACGFRVFWIFTIFRAYHDLTVLYVSYPISWALTASVHLICFTIIRRRQDRKLVKEGRM